MPAKFMPERQQQLHQCRLWSAIIALFKGPLYLSVGDTNLMVMQTFSRHLVHVIPYTYTFIIQASPLTSLSL